MLRTRRNWNQIILGLAMLLGVVIGFVICLANHNGLGKTIGSIVVVLCITAWVIAGIVLVLRGLNKM